MLWLQKEGACRACIVWQHQATNPLPTSPEVLAEILAALISTSFFLLLYLNAIKLQKPIHSLPPPPPALANNNLVERNLGPGGPTFTHLVQRPLWPERYLTVSTSSSGIFRDLALVPSKEHQHEYLQFFNNLDESSCFFLFLNGCMVQKTNNTVRNKYYI